jgi:predicted alpha/beta-fold hydrolase
MSLSTILLFILIIFTCLCIIYCIKEAVLNEPSYFRDKNEIHIFKKSPQNLRIKSAIDSLEAYRPNFLLPGAWLKLLLFLRPKEPFNFFTRKIYQFKDGG